MVKLRLRCSFAVRRSLTQDGVKVTEEKQSNRTKHKACRSLHMMTFQVGEKIIYPNHGVATIENISSRAFAGHYERFYLLRLTYASMTVMVPFSHVGELGLRRVTRNGEVARVVSYLSEERCNRRSDWKDRFQENTEKMRARSLLAVAEVMKGLLGL